MALQAFLSDDVTAATSISFSAVTGTPTSATRVHLWLDKGTAGSEAHGIAGWPEVEYPASSGTWISSGHPALDEGWFQAAVVSGVNTANDKRFVIPNGTTYRVVKTSKPLEIGDLYGNTAVYIDVRVTAPLDASAATFSWRFRITSDVVVQSTDRGIPCGVIRGMGDTTQWDWITAPVITATGTPDDKVHGSFHSANWYGLFKQRCYVDDLTLNQNDGASSALTTGQAYIALISRSSDFSTALTVTKGTRTTAAAAVAPALPAGNKPVATVKVAYHATASVINTSDITNLAVDGWARVTAGTGLQAVVGAFRIQMPGSLVALPYTQTVALTASSTNRIWINTDGTTSVVTTDDNPPYVGSEWIANAVTDGSGVTSVVDKRRFEDSAGQWVELQVAAGNEATGTAVARRHIGYAHQLIDVRSAVVTASSGATGSTTCDVNRKRAGASATVFTSQGGSTETRPAIAAQAYTATGLPELTSDGNAGDVYSADVDAITSGGSRAADLSVSLLIYPRPS